MNGVPPLLLYFPLPSYYDLFALCIAWIRPGATWGCHSLRLGQEHEERQSQGDVDDAEAMPYEVGC